jgi:hypothetical protein
MTEMISVNFRQPPLYPPCLPDGYTLVSVMQQEADGLPAGNSAVTL